MDSQTAFQLNFDFLMARRKKKCHIDIDMA